MTDMKPVTTDTCEVLSVTAGIARVRFGYGDGTTFETEVAGVTGTRRQQEAALRVHVAGPKGEEAKTKIAWPEKG